MKKIVITLICILVILIVLIIGGYIALNKNMISKDEALKISYEYANVDESEVTLKFISTDYSSFEYEIEFYDNYYKYEIDVNFINGSINNYEKDALEANYVKSSESVTMTEDEISSYIGTEEAKKIALNHANLSDNDVIWHEAKLDIEHSIAIYEIEFYYNNIEYDYEINALTGEIISYEKDKN